MIAQLWFSQMQIWNFDLQQQLEFVPLRITNWTVIDSFEEFLLCYLLQSNSLKRMPFYEIYYLASFNCIGEIYHQNYNCTIERHIKNFYIKKVMLLSFVG